jgi:hypothetical protein
VAWGIDTAVASSPTRGWQVAGSTSKRGIDGALNSKEAAEAALQVDWRQRLRPRARGVFAERKETIGENNDSIT